MSEKERILNLLREEFEQWEALLAELSEEDVTAAQEAHSGGLSIKDELAHLWAWQVRSNARMEAAVQEHAPHLPGWPPDLDPDSEEDLAAINAWIYETNRDRSWNDVYRDWHEGYLRLIRLGEAVPEEDLLEVGRYPWLKDYALAAVLEGSWHHHHEEHLEPLLARLGYDEG